ncbi:MAG: PilX N-terminal domain-containing pilus assembly protein, partial [Chromatiaceae bacterium]|nr:PilX N-terminal domain-containing pilus assembly protein [Candidatus Thioaporhodococcus sediminis]
MRRHLSVTGLEGSQRGAAALPVGVLLLFIAALVLIAVARTTLMEQRISANEIRVRQALQAAQAGISHAMAYLQAGGIDRVSPTQQADAITPLTLPSGASYQVYFCDPSPTPRPDPYPPV